MSSPIHAYLMELRRLVAGVTPDEARRLIAEVHDHLREATEEFQASGMGLEEAERTAIQAFGPAQLAVQGLKEERMIEMDIVGIRLWVLGGMTTPESTDEILECWVSPWSVGASETPREREQQGKPTPVILLREHGGSRHLPIWVGAVEAASIATALEGRDLPRPLTHDFTAALVRASERDPEAVLITRCENGTFYAELVLMNRAGERLAVDCRPSDGIAVAVRLSLPVYVAADMTDYFMSAA